MAMPAKTSAAARSNPLELGDDSIDSFYNPLRRHSTIGYFSPDEFRASCSPGHGGRISKPSTESGQVSRGSWSVEVIEQVAEGPYDICGIVVGVAGEPTLGKALELATQEWQAGNRDRELRLHLLFLSWYCNVEPPHLTGLVEESVSSDLLPALFRGVYESFSPTIMDDVEGLYVVGLIAALTPWLLGDDVATWEARSKRFRTRYRTLLTSGLPPSHFEGRGAYGDYFAGQVQVPGGY